MGFRINSIRKEVLNEERRTFPTPKGSLVTYVSVQTVRT